MGELKELISMVAGLPTVVVWVLVGYLVYKLAVLGSIYGVMRLLIDKAHNWLTAPKKVEWDLADITIGSSTKLVLTEQLIRMRLKSNYIQFEDAERLRRAIDWLLEQEAREKAKRVNPFDTTKVEK